jgi:ribosomal protein S18 acetylase RimI-like enzyme
MVPESNGALELLYHRGVRPTRSGDIELARPSDQDAVAACVYAAYRHYTTRLGREPAPMLADYATLIARGRVYLVRERAHGVVCGVLVIEPQDDALFIENVAVHPGHQRQGLGRRLLLFAEQQAANQGLNQLRLYTNELMTENIAYYRRLGYEEVDRRTDHGFRRVFMRKVLAAG